MKIPRRQLLHLAAGAAALPAVSRIAGAQTYPARPITIIVANPAGGPSDVIARILAERMRRSLGQTIIVENVSGAGGSIGTGRVARARPDGYTIEVGALSNHVLNGAFYSLQYDLLNDFAPIAPLVTVSFVLFARKTLPPEGVKELITSLKLNPNRTSAGIATATATYHAVTASFQKLKSDEFSSVFLRPLSFGDGRRPIAL